MRRKPDANPSLVIESWKMNYDRETFAYVDITVGSASKVTHVGCDTKICREKSIVEKETTPTCNDGGVKQPQPSPFSLLIQQPRTDREDQTDKNAHGTTFKCKDELAVKNLHG